MREVLGRYVGRVIGVNLHKTHQIDAAELVAVSDENFSLRSATDGHLHHIPYAEVVQVIEDPEGVEIRHLFTVNERFEIVIKIGHVIAYLAT